MLGIVVNLVRGGLAVAEVQITRNGVHAANLDLDPVAPFKHMGGSVQGKSIQVNFPGFAQVTFVQVPGFVRLGPFLIQGAERCPDPASIGDIILLRWADNRLVAVFIDIS